MKLKILSNKILLVGAIVGLVLFLGIIFHFVFQDDVSGGLAQFTASATAFYKQKDTDLVGFPLRLKIPNISINAAVEYVGITPDGAMGVPAGPANVAWFKLGPRPGEVGSSVIDGHSGYKNNKPAVFDNLYKLQKGDKIYVEGGKGEAVVFVVREVRSFDRNKNASEIFVSNDGLSHLNLITCTGVWNDKDKTHSERLVVFADKEI